MSDFGLGCLMFHEPLKEREREFRARTIAELGPLTAEASFPHESVYCLRISKYITSVEKVLNFALIHLFYIQSVARH